MPRRSASVKRAHRSDDFIELALGQLREDRQRYHLCRRTLGLGTAPRLVTEVREARLKVERERIVNRSADTPFLQKGLQIVAAGNAERVLIEDRDIAPVSYTHLRAHETP